MTVPQGRADGTTGWFGSLFSVDQLQQETVGPSIADIKEEFHSLHHWLRGICGLNSKAFCFTL